MELLVTTTPGIEDVSKEEIKELINKEAEKVRSGMLRLNCTQEDLFKLSIHARTIYRVILLLLETEFDNLEDIYRKIREIDFSDFIEVHQSFAVRAERIDKKQNFTSHDLASATGQAIIDSFREKGARLKVNLEKPDVIFRAEVCDNTLRLGIDTTGDHSLSRRNYRVYQHPASLKPVISFSLVKIAGWKASESLIDPTCGSGTIPIEAARFAYGLTNRKNTAMLRLSFLDTKKFLDMHQKAEIKEEPLRIYGCDISRKHIQGAKKNAEKAGVKVEFFCNDARRIALDYDIIISNPPYGIRLGNPRKIENFYKDFARNLKKYEREWNKLVVLTASPLFEKYMGEAEKRMNILYGSLPARILIY